MCVHPHNPKQRHVYVRAIDDGWIHHVLGVCVFCVTMSQEPNPETTLVIPSTSPVVTSAAEPLAQGPTFLASTATNAEQDALVAQMALQAGSLEATSGASD